MILLCAFYIECAVDLDSVMSSLICSYLLDQNENKHVVPFINTPCKRVLEMRGEIQHVLHSQQLSSSELLYMDEVLDKAIKSNEPVELFLVDHNEVSGQWHRKYSQLKYRIIGIIDHHQDSSQFSHAAPRFIRPCGSSASLLVDYFKDRASARLDKVAAALLRTIIFDTVNLTWRSNELDLQAVEYLKSKLCITDSTDSIMRELEGAVESVPETAFDIYDLLYKDYKLYLHTRASGKENEEMYYAISTLHTSFHTMIGDEMEHLEYWTDRVRRFLKDEQLAFLLMTNAVREPGSPAHTQQFAIFTSSECDYLLPVLLEWFQSHSTQLSTIMTGDDFGLYDQENITISRKQFHPLTKEFMSRNFP